MGNSTIVVVVKFPKSMSWERERPRPVVEAKRGDVGRFGPTGLLNGGRPLSCISLVVEAGT
jgi:hypothetical protein